MQVKEEKLAYFTPNRPKIKKEEKVLKPQKEALSLHKNRNNCKWLWD